MSRFRILGIDDSGDASLLSRVKFLKISRTKMEPLVKQNHERPAVGRISSEILVTVRLQQRKITAKIDLVYLDYGRAH